MYIQLMIDNTGVPDDVKLNKKVYDIIINKIKIHFDELIIMDKEGAIKASRHIFILNDMFNYKRLKNICDIISHSREIYEEAGSDGFRFLILLKTEEVREEFWYNVVIEKDISKDKLNVELRNYVK